MQEYDAYCVRCKKKTLIDEPEEVTMKNGRPAVRGKCGECGVSVYRILPKKDVKDD